MTNDKVGDRPDPFVAVIPYTSVTNPAEAQTLLDNRYPRSDKFSLLLDDVPAKAATSSCADIIVRSTFVINCPASVAVRWQDVLNSNPYFHVPRTARAQRFRLRL